MAIMELVLQSTYFNQQCISRFNYISVGTPAAVSLSFALTSAFGCIYDPDGTPAGYPNPSVFWAIRATQVPTVQYDFVTTKNVYSTTDFYETPFLQAANGLRSGNAMSPTAAMGYRTGRVRSDIRRGYKRFVGLSEGDVGDGGVIGATFLSNQMTVCAGYLTEPLTYNDEGNIISFLPCVVKKEKYTPNPLRPERVAYKYFDTQTEQEANIATGINFDPYPTQRTQTSRQYGRGR
jgi:hypothetical protein